MQRVGQGLAWALQSNRRAMAVLALLALVLFLPGFFTLQPMDRDEPRFAQASKQMIETGDAVDIRFQGEARHKKPVGIYWMQAGIVTLAEKTGVPAARTTIWLYRLPSLAGAVLSVLLTYWAGLAFMSRRTAFLAAALFASCVLIGVEARLAKTDAVVAATVAATMAVLARAYLAQAGGALLPLHQRLIFWSAMAIGLLVKGPITPMVVIFTALAIWAVTRERVYLKALGPVSGLILCLALVAPWFILIFQKTGGAFFSESLGDDMLGKVAAGREAHGAPPGTYLAIFWLTAWPLAAFAALAAPFAWRDRRDPKVMFLLAWIVPTWLLFELVPTKLPHYVLPVFPALALMVGLALEHGDFHAKARWRLFVLILIPLVAVLGGLAGAVLWYLSGSGYGIAWFALVTGVGGSLGLRARRAVIEDAPENGILFAVACAVFMLFNALAFALTTRAVDFVSLSPRLALARALAGASAGGCAGLAPVTAGYREPSLVFLTSTDLVMTPGAEAAKFLTAAPCRIAFIEAREEAGFNAALARPDAARLVSRVQGVNLNGGRFLDIGVYVQTAGAP